MQDELAEIVAGMVMLAIIIGVIVYFALWVILIGGVIGAAYLIFKLCEKENYGHAGVVLIITIIVVIAILNAM